ncbi:MAG: plasmid mobilization relaxosome protein MobC [Lachnospiraceae bacterium]|nr:plasmid mobilization relaxosome protein MobC [Lachnospiraceae bacterium]
MLIGRGKQLIEPRKNFTIRLSDGEREQTEYDARVNNMKVSDYVRYLIAHGGRLDTSFTSDRRDLIRQISGLCNNYNQMTKIANGCGYVFDSTMKDANHLMKQIKEKMKELAGKWQ